MMQRCKCRKPHRSGCPKSVEKQLVRPLGKHRILVFSLHRERICFKPRQQFFVKTDSSVQILRSMHMQITKCRNNNSISVIFHFLLAKLLWKFCIKRLYNSILNMQKLLLSNLHIRSGSHIYKITFNNHISLSSS